MDFLELVPQFLKEYFGKAKNIAFILFCIVLVQAYGVWQIIIINIERSKLLEDYKTLYEAQETNVKVLTKQLTKLRKDSSLTALSKTNMVTKNIEPKDVNLVEASSRIQRHRDILRKVDSLENELNNLILHKSIDSSESTNSNFDGQFQYLFRRFNQDNIDEKMNRIITKQLLLNHEKAVFISAIGILALLEIPLLALFAARIRSQRIVQGTNKRIDNE